MGSNPTPSAVTADPRVAAPPGVYGPAEGRGQAMTDKSPRKSQSKKSGKTLKQKRQDKKDKEQTKKAFPT